ncbi:hypothetical protein L6R49_22260 [Myxococcota bacterium]|nr:hypothetical protein [Myxococcota bacterium]
MSLSQEGHPLRLLGAGPWLAEALTRRTAEPEELLDLLDRAMAHRRPLPERDEPAWTRSVEHAAGAHVAARLLALPPDPRWDTLRLLLGLGEPAEGLLAGERAGLVSLSGGRVTVTAVARGLTEGEARGGLLAGLEGAGLPEDLQRVLVPALEGSSVSNQSSPTPSSGGGALVADAAKVWIDGLSVPRDVELLARGLEALSHANRAAHYSDEARLRALGPTVLMLRSAAQSAEGGAQVAAALAELIVLTAAWLPEDEEAQARAVEALRRSRTQGVIPEAVWAAALVRRADRLLDAPQERDARDEAARVLDEVAALDAGPRIHAHSLRLLGRLHMQRGEGDKALRLWREEVLPILNELGDRSGAVATMAEIADALQARGQLDEALRIRREEMLPLLRQLGFARGEALTKGKIADVYQERGQLDEALRIRREEVLPVVERLGDIRSKAVTTRQIADVLQARGQLDEALRILREEVLPIFERLGDTLNVAYTQLKMAELLQVRGQGDEAQQILTEEVLPRFERLGDVRGKAVTLNQMAVDLAAEGAPTIALQVLQEDVLPAFVQLGDVRQAAFVRGRIADLMNHVGQHDDALRIYQEETLPVLDQLGEAKRGAITRERIADLLATRGERDEAVRLYREEVLPAFEQFDERERLIWAQTKLATLLLKRDHPDDFPQARALLLAAEAAAVKLELPTHLAVIRSTCRLYAISSPT